MAEQETRRVSPAVRSAILEAVQANLAQLDNISNIIKGVEVPGGLAARDLYSKNDPGDLYSKNTAALEGLDLVSTPSEVAASQLRTKLSQFKQ